MKLNQVAQAIYNPCILLVLLFGYSHTLAQSNSPQPAAYAQQMNAAPLLFMENKGQVADAKGGLRPDVLFTATSGGAKLYLTATGIHYQFTKTEYTKGYEPHNKTKYQNPQKQMELQKQMKTATHRFTLQLQEANNNPVIKKENPSPYTENYYLAQCPNGITGVKSFERIVYQNVYPNIDWVLYSKGGFMEYDFFVHPGGNPSLIKLKIQDANNVSITPQGELLIKTSLGEVQEKAPVSFADGKQVSSLFKQNDDGSIGFEVSGFEGKELRIDPALEWATYYGGTDADRTYACKADKDGNVYAAGITASTGLAQGGFQNALGGNTDAYLVKVNATGSRLWATYYGGDDIDAGYTCALDSSGNVYLAGAAASKTGISFNGFQNERGTGGTDAFMVKFDKAGTRIWATYYGGNATDQCEALTVDSKGNIYMAGITYSENNIAYNGLYNTWTNTSGFLAKFDHTGNRVWGTYYGGQNYTFAYDCALDKNENIYLAGITTSSTNIASGGFDTTHYGASLDGFLAKFDGSGKRLWATYYGGELGESGFNCVVDSHNNVYLAGTTESRTGIATGGYDNTFDGYTNAFLVKFDSTGQRKWATYYGGSAGETYCYSSAIDNRDNIYIVGSSYCKAGIAQAGFQNSIGGGWDSYVAKFDTSGARIWGSYFGGNLDDYGWFCSTDGNNNIYLAGHTKSDSGIAVGGAQAAYGGGLEDGFFIKISDATVPLHLLSFTAQKQPSSVALQWRTANEQNTSHFIIQRSYNGSVFTSIGNVAAKGANAFSQDYHFTDNAPFTTHHSLYYRLQMLDKDGKYSYSNVEKLTIQGSLFTIVPNPAKGSVSLQLAGFAKGSFLLAVYDAASKEVYKKVLVLSNSTYFENIPLGKLAAGIYKVAVGGQVQNLVVE